MPFVARHWNTTADVKESPRAAAADFFARYPDEPVCTVYHCEIAAGYVTITPGREPLDCTPNSLYLLPEY